MTSNIDQEKATLATEKEPPKTLAAQKEQQQEEDQEDIPLPVKFGYKKGLCLHLSLSTEAHENCALREPAHTASDDADDDLDVIRPSSAKVLADPLSFEDEDGERWGLRKSSRIRQATQPLLEGSLSSEDALDHDDGNYHPQTKRRQPRKAAPAKKGNTKHVSTLMKRSKKGRLVDDEESLTSTSEEDNPSYGAVRFSTRSTKRSTVNYAKNTEESEDDDGDEDGDEDETRKKSSKNVDEHEQGVIPFPKDAHEANAIEWVMDRRYKKKDNTCSYDEGSSENIRTGEVQYLIKWKGLSHLHNSWNSHDELKKKTTNTKKIDAFIQQMSEERSESQASGDLMEERAVELELTRALYEEFKIVERILDVQEKSVQLIDDDEEDRQSDMRAVRRNRLTLMQKFFLVKWKSLPYSECTWESEDYILPKYEHAVKQFEWLDSKNHRAPSIQHPHKLLKEAKKRPKFIKMDGQPVWLASSPEGVGLALRDYQLDGLNWLAYSWHRDINTILADEMGLGKTIQTVSFLSYLYHEMDIDGPFLLVVPLSTIHAWMKELNRWAPSMNAIMYIGDAKSRRVILQYEFYRQTSHHHLKFNVLVTTYELVLKDYEAVLSPISWALLVVDEAHRLKNADSLLHKTLKTHFTFYNRLLITGTPLQNSLKELYALLTFLEPAKFPDSWEVFEANLISLGEKSASTEGQLKHLHSLLKPHLLRRLKKDVEKSLPQKTERILRVEMSPLQRQLYKWILTRNYKELNRCTGDMTGSKMTSLLNIISELKKASNHPYLFHNGQTQLARKIDLEGIVYHSGKMVLLDALLQRLLSTGHRVLIFSQSVALLDILGEFLDMRRWPSLRLDGSVPSDVRKRSIERFNSPDSIYNVFLLSTRAGGLGINLETADTVILFDSDWNPQNDLQAMARAHRIGQKKGVNIYRLVSKHTVEEEILERAKKKMVLDHLVIQRMDTSGRTVLPLKSTPAVLMAEDDPDEAFEEPQLSGKPQKSSANQLQSILMFGAKALFKQEESGSKVPSKPEQQQLLLHQLMAPSSISVKAMTNDLDGDCEEIQLDGGTAIHPADLPDGLKTVFTRPNCQLDLDDILARAEETDSAIVKTAEAERDENNAELLDSFKVADLSGALSWAAIIPEKDRTAAEDMEKEVKERQEALDLYESYERRQTIKEDARDKMKAKKKQPTGQVGKNAEVALKKIAKSKNNASKMEVEEKKKKIVKKDEGATSQLEALFHQQLRKCSLSLSNDDDVASLVQGLLQGLSCFGLVSIRDRGDKLPWHGIHAANIYNENSYLIATCIMNACRDFVLQQHEVESEKPDRILRSSLYHQAIFPTTFIRKVEQLDRLHQLITEQDLTNVGIPLHGSIKQPQGWSVPWSSRDDSSLLLGVWKHGYGQWYDLRKDPELGLEKKMAFLDVATKKKAKGKEPSGHVESHDDDNKSPNKEHIKRRVDYLLDHLSATSADSQDSLNTSTALNQPKLPPKKKPRKEFRFESDDFLKDPLLVKFFKKLFKPLKKELLAFSVMEDESTAEFKQMKRTTLAHCKEFVYSIIILCLEKDKQREDTGEVHIFKEHLQQILAESSKEELAFLERLSSKEALEYSLWSFVKLCWPVNVSNEDLMS